jgi:hypothetical protein
MTYASAKLTYASDWREAAKLRRDTNREQKRCVNENKDGTHGPATHGNCCRRCRAVHRFGAEVVERDGLDALLPIWDPVAAVRQTLQLPATRRAA